MDFSKQYQKAEDAYKKRNYDYAVEIYLSILKMDPNQVKARSTLRALLVKKKEEGTYKQTGRIGQMGFLTKLKTIQVKKAWDQIITECDRHLTTDMDNVAALKALGLALMHLEHNDAAIQVLETARQQSPKDAEIYRNLGRIFQATGDLENAKKFWEVTVQLAPADAEAARTLRDIHAKITSKVWEVGDDYRTKIRDEKMSKVLEEQAHLIRTEDDVKRSLAMTEELIGEEDDAQRLSKLWRKKAELLDRIRDYDAAREAYEKQLEYDPDSYDAADRVGDMRLKALEDKLRVAREAGAGELDKLQKEYEVAQIQEFERRIKAHPTDMKHRFDHGRASLRAGELDKAIESLQHSVNDGKLQLNSLLLLSQAFARKGLFDFARSQCQRALDTTEGRKTDVWKAATYTMGDICERAGDLQSALTNFEELYLVDIGYRDVGKRYENLRKKLEA